MIRSWAFVVRQARIYLAFQLGRSLAETKLFEYESGRTTDESGRGVNISNSCVVSCCQNIKEFEMVVWNEIHLGVFKSRSFSNLQDGKVLLAPPRGDLVELFVF
jgi:hypothetical protein